MKFLFFYLIFQFIDFNFTLYYNHEMKEGTFAERLKLLRKKHGHSQDEMAAKLGISAHAYLNYEKGKIQPKIGILEKLRELFNVNLNWLLDGSGTMENAFEIDEATAADPRVREFIHWFSKYSIVQFAALTTLEELKIKHPDLFSKESKESPDQEE